jgi:hypothetical protein
MVNKKLPKKQNLQDNIEGSKNHENLQIKNGILDTTIFVTFFSK